MQIHLFKITHVYSILTIVLKRSHECLLYTNKDRNCDLFAVIITACTTFTSRENVLNTNCYFYLPRIFYEWKYTITWLLWNATSRDANIVVKLAYFRYDRLWSTKTHIIIMATMKTGMIYNTFVILMTIVGSLGHVLMV